MENVELLLELLVLTPTRDLIISILNCINLETAQSHGPDPEVLKGLAGHWDDRLDEFVCLSGQVPNLLLGVVLHTELEEVKEVMKVNFPIKFSESVLG